MANSLPMTLRVYRKLSFAMVPLAPALIKSKPRQKPKPNPLTPDEVERLLTYVEQVRGVETRNLIKWRSSPGSARAN